MGVIMKGRKKLAIIMPQFAFLGSELVIFFLLGTSSIQVGIACFVWEQWYEHDYTLWKKMK